VQTVLATLPFGLAIHDRHRRIIAFNDLFAQILGFHAGFVRHGTPAYSLLVRSVVLGHYGARSLSDVRVAWLSRLASGQADCHTLCTADGRTLSVNYAPLPDGGGTIGVRDITEQVATARALQETHIRSEAAFSHMPLGLCMFDDDRNLILCSRAYAEIYGLPPELSRPGTRLADIMAHRFRVGNAPRDMTGYLKVGTDAKTRQQLVCRRVHLQDGRWVQITHNPMPGGGYVSTHQDITAAIRAEQKSRYLAEHDTLTGLLNRAALREQLARMLRRAKRQTTLAVHCLDLDQFKSVNDTLGHPIGDLLMVAVTKRLRSCLGPDHVLARVGGDEFVVLQDDVTCADQASDLTGRLISALNEPFIIDDQRINIGLSVGTALHPEHGADADELLKKADIALYRSKAQGRNTSRIFEPTMVLPLQRRRALELDFRTALARGGFTLHYQPIVNIATRRVNRFEALARWTHRDHGCVEPADFIALAEDTGLIIPFGEWVIRQACRNAAAWPCDIGVAINLSPVQFRRRGLADLVLGVLQECRLPPQRLEVEITESVLLADTDATTATLHQLREAGVRIALDDFGTGYSSLSYLRSFPFDKIKVDKSFIRDVGRGRGHLAIVKAVADLGAALGMTTTAEGVETHDELRQAWLQGCTEAQGFLFSRACPVEQVGDMLQLGSVAACVKA
jgi:diguanylate cyclase (GGDEF)-like protein